MSDMTIEELEAILSAKRAEAKAKAQAKANAHEPFLNDALLELFGKGSAPVWKVMMPAMMALRAYQTVSAMTLDELRALVGSRLVPGVAGKSPKALVTLKGNRKALTAQVSVKLGGSYGKPVSYRHFAISVSPKGPMMVKEGNPEAAQAALA